MYTPTHLCKRHLQANAPVPTNRLVFYFEARVLQRGDRCRVTIGFSDGKAKVGRQPGTERNSYGYSADGKLYWDEDKTREYGPSFNKGDVVGAGIDLERGDVFFTRNGINLGTAFPRVRQALYPTLSVHSPGEVVRLNFGQDPFMFDVAALESSIRSSKRKAIEEAPTSQGVSPTDPQALVRQLLLQYGYPDTLAALSRDLGEQEQGEGLRTAGSAGASTSAAAAASSSTFEGQLESSLAQRGSIRRLIMAGRVDEAEALVREQFPEALEEALGPASFSLALQKVVERIAAGGEAQDPVEVVESARAYLGPIMTRLLKSVEELGHSAPADVNGQGGGPGAMTKFTEGDDDEEPMGRSLSVDTTVDEDAMQEEIGEGQMAGGRGGGGPGAAGGAAPARASSAGAVELVGGGISAGGRPTGFSAFAVPRVPANFEPLGPRARTIFDDSRVVSPTPHPSRRLGPSAQLQGSGGLFKDARAEAEKKLAEIGEVMAAVCFPDPKRSPHAHLLDIGRRGFVADIVNSAILEVLLSKSDKQSGDPAPRPVTAPPPPPESASPSRLATRSQPSEVPSSPLMPSGLPSSSQPGPNASSTAKKSRMVPQSALERLFRQLMSTQEELYLQNGLQGELPGL